MFGDSRPASCATCRAALLLAAVVTLVDCSEPTFGGVDGGSSDDVGISSDAEPDGEYPADVGSASDAGPLEITSQPVVLGSLGVTIEVALTAIGGAPPYSWSVLAGVPLPVGFYLSSDGILTGTPTLSGSFPFSVIVTDKAAGSAAATLELVVAEPITNDTCAAATSLPLVDGRASVSANLGGARADGAGLACQQSPAGPDVFYQLQLDEVSVVTVDLASASPLVVALLDSECPPVATPLGLGCAAHLSTTLPAGTYHLAVTGPVADSFQLFVEVERLTGDTCDDVIPLDLSGGSATAGGSFADAGEDLAVSCGEGVDRVYSFVLSAAADLHIKDGQSPTTRAIRAATCAAGAEIVCQRHYYGELVVRNVQPGTYYLIIQRSSPGVPATYAVTVQTTAPTLPPANDRCQDATPVTLINDTATISGTLLGATYDPVDGSCGGTESDVYFVLDLTAPSKLVLSPGAWGADVQLMQGPCAQPVPIACASHGVTFCGGGLAAGRYYLRVTTSDGHDAGPFSFTVTRHDPSTPPPNTTCATAQTLVVAAGRATVSGQLTAAGANLVVPCASTTAPVHEVVYELSLAQRSDVSFTVASPSADSVALGVIGADCATGQTLACLPGLYSGGVNLWGAPAGMYWVVLAGEDRFAEGDCWRGEYILDISVATSPPVPANDTCATATPYEFAGPGFAITIDGTTRGANDDLGAVNCGSGTADGQDVVYAFTLDTSARLRVTAVTHFSGMMFYLTSTCGGTETIACVLPYATQEFTTAALPPGTYYLVVDSSSSYGQGAPGDFSFVVDTLDP
jgi:hypothetical protein